MKTASANPESMLPLSPAVFHILLALTDGEQHGYAIMQDVTAGTDGQIRMGPGTLYGTIKRMLEGGLIEEVEDRAAHEPDDERRRYYRLTNLGRRVAGLEAERLSRLVQIARRKKLLTLKGAC